MRIYQYLWRGANPTVTERSHLPCRYLLAFDAIDAAAAQADRDKARINGNA